MKVTLFSCGPAVNESELKAFEHLKTRLQSTEGADEWVLLTNLAFSVTHQLQSDEIDIVVIGPPGIRVIEIKHWTSQWVEKNTELVEREADKLTNKARKVATTLRKIVPNLPHVDGEILLTQDSSKIKTIQGKQVRGVRFFSLKEWRDILQVDSPPLLTALQVTKLVKCKALEPKSAIAIDGSLRRIAGYVNLEIETPKEEKFHRIYKGSHPARQDRVILHLYDLSAGDEKNAENLAIREFDALHRMQLYPWAPRILDSYQEVPGFSGEMYFFTVVDPAAPSVKERAADKSWDVPMRLSFLLNAVRALGELHGSDPESGQVLHRNISSKTLLVKHDNSPIFTSFGLAKLPSELSISTATAPPDGWDPAVAPEVREKGLPAADQRSDTYSLCAAISILFGEPDNHLSEEIMVVLKQAIAEQPEDRPSLESLDASFSKLLGESIPSPPPPPARFWTEDQIVRFRDRDYRIVSRLGSGGVGVTFKVVEIERSTEEDVGTYVGKVAHNEDTGNRVLSAYTLARPHTARHANLSAIFEVARRYRENDFISLMTWIEGSPLAEFMGLLPLLAEDEQEESAEALVVRWLRSMCQALHVLHRNGLVHGDPSPRNMILSGSDLVMTDYDFVCKIGKPAFGKGTVLYSSPDYEGHHTVSPSDDLYALAASFFHVLFEREPFMYADGRVKERGLNWEGLEQDGFSVLIDFLNKATHPDPTMRYQSAPEAVEALDPFKSKKPSPDKENQGEVQIEPPGFLDAERRTEGKVKLIEQKIEWLHAILQSYPGSRFGNQETRGLDTPFAARTYVETELEEVLLQDILKRRARLVILCGNAGDGKTALLQHLASRLGLGSRPSSERILEWRMRDGCIIRINLDGSAAWQGRSADDLLDEFLAPFQDGPPEKDIVHLLAINDGRLLEWIERSDDTPLIEDLFGLLEGGELEVDPHIRFISLNQRSLVGGITPDRKEIRVGFLERLTDQLYGAENAHEIWGPCETCTAKERCEVLRAARIFGPDGIPGVEAEEIRSRARQRLFEALQAVHLRGEIHITVRELRAALVYILFGLHLCEDFHKVSDDILPYWDRAFEPGSYGRQGELLNELPRFDPALEVHPQIDRYLLSGQYTASAKNAPRYNPPSSLESTQLRTYLESARRRAYFEWSEDDLLQVTGDPAALDLARGRHLRLFRNIPLENDQMDTQNRAKICSDLCAGISRLEDLPPQALDRQNVVPLRITPRTPTETAFWIEKAFHAFRIEEDLPPYREGLDRLHRHVFLIYRYREGPEERLRLGAELFHLLLELGDGYQLGDISSEDTFAHLSIFVQRLVREDERELMAWNPMEEDSIFQVSARIDQASKGSFQRVVLDRLICGDKE
ncbi:MAG: NERD domain-containing protein [Desulfatiglandaceae bacterium]